MIIKKCDKCGTEISNNDYTQVEFPYILITEVNRFDVQTELHLCKRCEDAFRRWLWEDRS